MNAPVSLDDKYDLGVSRVYLTGTQALVRLPLMQQQRDKEAGFNTACFVSGYRGSPLGGVDQQFAMARRILEPRNIRLVPGVNEDLAATAAWGSQQAELHGEGRFDGVFAMWYGKGPGVDRSGDAFRHANLAGTSPHGGVLVLMGDDHTCESSTTAHQSEFALVDAMIPVLNPSGVQEIIDYGLFGWALSRYSGCWVGLKCVHDNVSSAASVKADGARVQIRLPTDYELPPGGLNIRRGDTPLAQERRLHTQKLDAVRAFARANGIDRVMIDNPSARVGIVSTGKSYLDTLQALDDLGFGGAGSRDFSLRLYKVGMPWPLEPAGLRAFAQGLDLLIIVEEKRGLIEPQVKDLLYGRPGAPRVIGKLDEWGTPLFPSHGALDSLMVARVVGSRLLSWGGGEALRARLAELDALAREPEEPPLDVARTYYFCSGCPHNSSTRVPEGSRAYAGIGCHWMAQKMDRRTEGYTQMGGEGANWVGEAPFSTRGHVFQNIGDGTYYHSGLLAIRQAIAAGVNITYKILFNDAVAMTGGQHVDGPMTVPMIAWQVQAEGVKRVVVVTDEPEKYPANADFPPGVRVYHRSDLEQVQTELREIAGTTVLIYDQTCAAEKRRRRKRGTMADPARRVFINEMVCEGCGDCGVKSNCVSVVPVETEFGRKRAIDQSSCNKDYSCAEGFCPSFVSVRGAFHAKTAQPAAPSVNNLPVAPAEPAQRPALGAHPYGIMITGVGGTGVVTIGQVLGMAAHIEGRGVSGLDMTGLAQKGGAVMSHLRLAARPEDIKAVRLGTGGADAIIGCDILVTGGVEALHKARAGVTRAVINTHETMPGEFTRRPDLVFPANPLRRRIEKAVGADRVEFIDATRLATALFGDSIAGNLFLLGLAYQGGLIPLGAAAIEQAIALNGAAVAMNQAAFRWGRIAAVDRAAVEAAADAASPAPKAEHLSTSLDEVIARRERLLTDYQDAAYAARYRALVERVRSTEQRVAPSSTALTEAVARYYAKLLAYKDEYEVARLHTDPAFLAGLHAQFAGGGRLSVHLAPPLLSPRDKATGLPRKREFGPWVWPLFRVLARLKGLRGTRWDIFGRTAERRAERQLIADYEATIAEILAKFDTRTLPVAIDLARLPERIRGYGYVKDRHIAEARAEEARLRGMLAGAPAPLAQAAE